MDWRPHVLRSGARFSCGSVSSPARVFSRVPTEVIELGMGLAPNLWGRDTDNMAGVVADGADVRIRIGTLSGRVGVRAAGCRSLRIHARRVEDVLFGLRLTDCEDVLIRIDEAVGLLPLDGEDQYPHLVYLDRCKRVRVKVGSASMRGDGASTYGTMLKFVLCDDVAVSVGEADWPWGHLEFQGCRRVRSRGGMFRSLRSRTGWGNPMVTVRNHDRDGEFRSCEDVEVRGAEMRAGTYPVAVLMHSDLGPGKGVSTLTTPRWPGSALYAPLGVTVDSYDAGMRLRVGRS
ncbi:MAG: hypothetical protein KF884_10620 [Fimbriimonadaceae bacterium]|nr:hypothetical protein [Fimbriimonadaceae bacterium]QYK57999.1 MAG: hypothetical protein KF884_10620 [Fimbriimonadaceae bacterium]